MELDEYVKGLNIADDIADEYTNYATKDFTIVVKGSTTSEKVYAVINKTYDVTEYADCVLSRAIQTMMQLQENLSAARHAYRGPILKAVDKGEDDDGEEGSLH